MRRQRRSTEARPILLARARNVFQCAKRKRGWGPARSARAARAELGKSHAAKLRGLGAASAPFRSARFGGRSRALCAVPIQLMRVRLQLEPELLCHALLQLLDQRLLELADLAAAH